ncbi:MAG: LysM peptidoglycan-binding domain-containing protein [Furfurilactobacillus sp.]|jgi:biotin carboxyl carrier protein|uniref:LysM peptidoglycan-binding domain-containing protein n=1 Tax=Furfurilactobacillus sp. TaxID=2767911 RepID=UPI0025896C8A|nr:LysM peptidoglycan-binding domain-containing protein [Furfurilactobacillus sp.]MCH4011385.1 LysM peptidoglycan-binding domain-containing protein [Furfurilactobacillus sp.]MCH4037277.1 LysM peptidoglycan-binding domain-containing protein [Furfurilactobacillus sp.]MCH4116085.1 LysM peptidoglycan-binding domain-containing protein [Furfurilactobacillus sp.]MCH4133428.1 LysM peptidoglycan-binding domain-containing protein [Furfurilactobacillus sp.]MCI1339583.1 LysM peptidoglycan-binding domain-c
MKIKQLMLSTVSAGALLSIGTVVANADTTVTVKSGDTVSKLASANNTTVDAIVNANHLQNGGNLIFVDQSLDIPGANGTQSTQAAQPAQQQTVQAQPAQQAAPVQQQAAAPAASTGDSSAQAWIAARESGGSYTAQNGQYYGKYQLSMDKLGGDLSPQHQEAVATQYAVSRYGSWAGAQAAWQSQGWW